MSFSISISGHSSEPHNAEVQIVFDEAIAKLKQVPGMANLQGSGYSGDASGSITLAFPGEGGVVQEGTTTQEPGSEPTNA